MNDVYDDVLIPRDSSVIFEFQDPDQPSGNARPSNFPSNLPTNGNFQPVENAKPQATSFFSMSYFQEFFNVNTDEVIKRVQFSLIPNTKINYYEEHIKSKPDLYGPLWICITLAFTIALGSNTLDFITTTDLPHWKYEFHVITKASLLVFVYVWIIPVILWSLIKWYLSSQMYLSAMELICVYGYCLVAYIPLSLLWVIPLHSLQWIFLSVVALSSGLVVMSSVQPLLTNNRNYCIIGGVIILHVFFSVVVFLSFFNK